MHMGWDHPAHFILRIPFLLFGHLDQYKRTSLDITFLLLTILLKVHNIYWGVDIIGL